MSTATEMRDAYLAAERDILEHGTTSRIGDRTLTTADLPAVVAGRKEWERRAADEVRGTGISFRVATFRAPR